MSHFRNVIFDLDGLMVDTEPLHRRAFNLVLAASGAAYEYGPAEYGRLITGNAIFENAEYIRERFALPQTAEEIANAHHALFSILIADAENLKPMPGLTELLEFVNSNGLRTAIASSSRPEQLRVILRGLNLVHAFDAVVGNDGSLKPKPAPDVYLLALQQLHADPSQTLALEDSTSGARAAQAAGLTVIAVPNEYTRGNDFSAADFVLANLLTVRDFLRKQLDYAAYP